MPIPAPLDRVRTERPEWRPWLAVVDEVLHDVFAPAWDEAAGKTVIAPQRGLPLLAGAALPDVTGAASRLLERLIGTACRAGAPRLATLRGVLHADVDVARLFESALGANDDRARELALDAGADADACRELSALLPVPFLQACNRRWRSEIQPGWIEPFCPVCGAWPAFVEVRGIERSRCFRCARCGSDWHARMLRCPFCGLDDHDRLVSLAPHDGGPRAIEACGRCLGYMKAFTTLDGCPPPAVIVEDLASVDLDLAALDLGYRRPKGLGYDAVTASR